MSKIVPFGKYKGQPVEVMADDREYCDWLLAQPWAKQKLGAVYNIVINSGAEPQDTPEHNALQAKFLDDSVCLGLWRRLCPQDAAAVLREPAGVEAEALAEAERALQAQVERHRKETANQQGKVDGNLARLATDDPRDPPDRRADLRLTYENWVREGREGVLAAAGRLAVIQAEDFAHSSPMETLFERPAIGGRVFEREGWDVVFGVAWRARARRRMAPEIRKQFVQAHEDPEFAYGLAAGGQRFAVEIKPTMGDDFPSVLRQVQRHGKGEGVPCVVLGSYTGQGATLDQVRAMFAASGIRLVMLGEIL